MGQICEHFPFNDRCAIGGPKRNRARGFFHLKPCSRRQVQRTPDDPCTAVQIDVGGGSIVGKDNDRIINHDLVIAKGSMDTTIRLCRSTEMLAEKLLNTWPNEANNGDRRNAGRGQQNRGFSFIFDRGYSSFRM